MTTLSGSATVERVMSSVGDTMTPESAASILALQPDPQVEERLEILAEKNSAGLLTDDERSEYESVIMMGDFVSIMKRRARRMLSNSQAGV